MAIIVEALKRLFQKPITLKYPQERKTLPDRFRGLIQIDYDKCIGCGLCAMDCPSNAITMVTIKREDRRVIRRPIVTINKCIFCGQCMMSCPRKAISFSKSYELAYIGKKVLKVEAKTLRIEVTK